MNYQTILVPGVAWPEYKQSAPKRVRDKQFGTRSALPTRIMHFINENPGCNLHDVKKVLSVDFPENKIINALDRLWKANKLVAEMIKVNGVRMRHYYIDK